MTDTINVRIDSHRLWLLSAGKEGSQLYLEDEDLSGANIAGCNASDAIIVNCKLDFAILTKTDFYKTNLASSSFVGATMIEAKLVKSDCDYTIFRNANMPGVMAFKCSFAEADMTSSNAKGADFTRAYFENTNFEYADLQNANFTDATLDNVCFHKANLNNVTGLESANIKSINMGSISHPRKLDGVEFISWFKREYDIV